jgi:hypothetical protein
MASDSTRLGVQHMIDDGFRYPSLTELNGGQSMLYTPVHPGFDILWSSKRKWAVCLWASAITMVLLIARVFRRPIRATASETYETLISIVIVLFWLTAVCFVLAIIVRFLSYSPEYTKWCYECFRHTYNDINLYRMRLGDKLYSCCAKINRRSKRYLPSSKQKRKRKKKKKSKNQSGWTSYTKYTNSSEDKYKMEHRRNKSEDIELMHKDDDFDGYGHLEYKDESESGTDFDNDSIGMVNV